VATPTISFSAAVEQPALTAVSVHRRGDRGEESRLLAVETSLIIACPLADLTTAS